MAPPWATSMNRGRESARTGQRMRTCRSARVGLAHKERAPSHDVARGYRAQRALEAFLTCLMSLCVRIHTEVRPEDTAQRGQAQQRALGHSPRAAAGAPFIPTENGPCDTPQPLQRHGFLGHARGQPRHVNAQRRCPRRLLLGRATRRHFATIA